MQLAVGRLGIVTEIDFKIIPQRLLTRTVMTQSFDDFVAWTMAAQERFKAAVASGSQAAVSDSLRAVDQTQVCVPLDINQNLSHTALTRMLQALLRPSSTLMIVPGTCCGHACYPANKIRYQLEMIEVHLAFLHEAPFNCYCSEDVADGGQP